MTDDLKPTGEAKSIARRSFWTMPDDALIHYAFTSQIRKTAWYREMVWEFLRGEVE